MLVKRKLLIWGTGDEAVRIIHRFPILNFFVDCFIDSNKSKCSFFERTVISPDEVDWNEPIFIIVATKKYYDEIANYLNNRDLYFGRDFTDCSMAWYHWLASFENDIFVKKIFMLQERMKGLEQWIPDAFSKLVFHGEIIRNYVYNNNVGVEEALLQCCCDEEHNLIELKGGVCFEYSGLKDFAVIFTELLINEDYYFVTENKAPLIIDAGANVGLAIYYFKTLYPDARIIAFEPMPSLYNIIMRNIERNHWKDVQVYPCAVSDIREVCTFFVQNSGLAGSLEMRNQEGVNQEEISEISVQSVCLSDYMGEAVDYLKMDVEGSETKVIQEIREHLKDVNHLFIEFHEGKLKGDNSIAKIINVLEEQGFDINISKSFGSGKSSCYKPMEHVGSRVSEVIWAKRV